MIIAGFLPNISCEGKDFVATWFPGFPLLSHPDDKILFIFFKFSKDSCQIWQFHLTWRGIPKSQSNLMGYIPQENSSLTRNSKILVKFNEVSQDFLKYEKVSKDSHQNCQGILRFSSILKRYPKLSITFLVKSDKVFLDSCKIWRYYA